MMYNEIYQFCKARNKGNCFNNGLQPTPRMQFLMSLVESKSINYELDTFNSQDEFQDEDDFQDDTQDEDEGSFLMYKKIYRFHDERKQKNNFFNLILPGSSNKMVVAHHDIVNPSVDNANDNSASCINAIALKLMVPELNVVLLDGEEYGGIGSQRLSEKINNGDFGAIEWVLNLELTGKGGDLFFIGDYPGPLSNRILSLFDCPIFNTPYNDSVTLRKNGIDSTVINPLPIKTSVSRNRHFEPIFMNGKELDPSILMHCHSFNDTVNNISTGDMKTFVENVLYKIVTS